MPAAMTYDTLVSDIQVYTERDDDPFIAQIPRFIMLAENRIASESKPLGLLRVVNGTLGSNVMNKPVRWRKTRSFCLLVGAERKYQIGRASCRERV